MKIAVLGAGAGGTAVAFDCAAHGHEVRLFDFPQFPDNIEVVASQAGIHAEGDISGYDTRRLRVERARIEQRYAVTALESATARLALASRVLPQVEVAEVGPSEPLA